MISSRSIAREVQPHQPPGEVGPTPVAGPQSQRRNFRLAFPQKRLKLLRCKALRSSAFPQGESHATVECGQFSIGTAVISPTADTARFPRTDQSVQDGPLSLRQTLLP